MNRIGTKQRGFTLVETLVALALITIISLIVMGALSPWMGFKQKMDTERRIQDVRQGLVAYYEAQAMAVERQPAGKFSLFTSSTPDGEGRCELQTEAFEAVSDYFSESPQQLSRDGYANPWCIFVSSPFKIVRDGVDLWYRNVAVISTGGDGVLDPATKMQPDGTLVVAGDDAGAIVSGREVQAEKLKETLKRMNKVAQMYETYFTTRFLANTSRDITVYYFSKAYDTTGAVPATGGSWAKAAETLKDIGVGATDANSAWELDSALEVGNQSETINGVQVRSPATAGTGVLPYTALIRAKLPAPAGQNAYATQVVVGNY